MTVSLMRWNLEHENSFLINIIMRKQWQIQYEEDINLSEQILTDQVEYSLLTKLLQK